MMLYKLDLVKVKLKPFLNNLKFYILRSVANTLKIVKETFWLFVCYLNLNFVLKLILLAVNF